MMITNIWTHRLIIILSAIVGGFIVDQLSPSPLWGIAASLALIPLGLWWLSKPSLLENNLDFDHITASVLRTVFLAIIFFGECILAAWLIAR